jgi:protein-S-isoprenylcysteine O-methyltransferase Ste14
MSNGARVSIGGIASPSTLDARIGSPVTPPGAFRHLLSVLLLPFNVMVVIPGLLLWRNWSALPAAPGSLLRILQVAGGALIALGLCWFAGSLRRFAAEGQGTLAPWDPPRRLVVTGLYRYVRNPMITGVCLVLLGEAALLLSRPHLTWALAFIGTNALVIPLVEEPRLRRRFGAEYQAYCQAVPRLIPRVRPWQPPSDHQGTEA